MLKAESEGVEIKCFWGIFIEKSLELPPPTIRDMRVYKYQQ